MYKVLAIAVITATCVLSCRCAAEVDIMEEIGPLDQRTIKVHFKLPKTQYLVAEPIFLSVGMENYGSNAQYYRSHEEWLLNVRDEQGRLAKFKGLPEEQRMGDPFVPGVGGAGWGTIEPHTMAGGSRRNLLDWYGDGQGMDYYLLPGTYTITARDLKSDTVTIKVMWPSSGADSNAAAVLLTALDSARTMLSPAERRYRFYSDFVSKYPNSIYTPRALRWLVAMFPGEVSGFDQAKKQYYVCYLIMKFPESGYAWEALLDLNPAFVPVNEKAAVAKGLHKLKSALGAEDLRRRADELIHILEK